MLEMVTEEDTKLFQEEESVIHRYSYSQGKYATYVYVD